jgi:hypothetical protein
LKLILLGVVPLYAPHIGGHQTYGSIQDTLVQRVEIALLNEQGANFLQSKRDVRFFTQVFKHAANDLSLPYTSFNAVLGKRLSRPEVSKSTTVSSGCHLYEFVPGRGVLNGLGFAE